LVVFKSRRLVSSPRGKVELLAPVDGEIDVAGVPAVSTVKPGTQIFPCLVGQLRQNEALLMATASSPDRLRPDAIDDDRTEAVVRQASHATLHVPSQCSGFRRPRQLMPNISAGAARTKGDSACQKRTTIDAFCCIVLHSFAERSSEPNFEKRLFYRLKLVLPDRIELSTSSLPMKCSTTELQQRPVGSRQSG
jgi:hypothetical protein